MASNETLTGSGTMAIDEGGFFNEGDSEINQRIDKRLTTENLRSLMDRIQQTTGELDDEDYGDICESVRTWVCETFCDSPAPTGEVAE